MLVAIASIPLHAGLVATTLRPAPMLTRDALGRWWNNFPKALAAMLVAPIVILGSGAVWADDELAKYAAEGNAVAVDGECFIKKCSIQTSRCASDQNCLKGLSCLAR